MKTGKTHSPLSIILASSSPYRQALLQRLGLDFQVISPAIDETARDAETAEQLVRRLARAKAARVAETVPRALIIASDQVAERGGDILTKPGTRERAREQLRQASGHTVRFFTGLCLLNSASGHAQVDCIRVAVHFRVLGEGEIERYLDREVPYDCAGAFKSEQLGIALTRGIETGDASALVGLPLIRLTEMLRQEGLPIP